MTLQKDFLFASLPVAGWPGILLFMESQNLCAFHPASSWLRNSGNFIFYSRHKFLGVLWSRRRLKKKESESHKKAGNSISDINLLISISARLFSSFPFIKSRQPWTSPWKMNSIKRLLFIMIALDVASLNPFRCHKTTDNHFSVRDFSWAQNKISKTGTNNNTKFSA